MSLVGRTFRNIEILGTLGAGGMGEVYLGIDQKLKRRVAVKAIRNERRFEAKHKRRFLREAQILGQLDHPKICKIHEFVETEEHDLIVLELVEGETLQETIDRGIERHTQLDLAIQIATALDAAHAMSLVHRDLKPDNIMVMSTGEIKVLDFGLARQIEESQSTAHDDREVVSFDDPGEQDESRSRQLENGADDSLFARTAATLTEFGEIMGTPRFMSPEQARGQEATAASDMYSLGLLLQVLFTGTGPYEKTDDPNVMLTKIVWGDTVPVSGVPQALAALINQLKSLKPGERPSAKEVLLRLKSIADRPRRLRRRVLIAGVWVVLAAFAIGMAVQSHRAEIQAQRAEDEALVARQVADFLVEIFSVSDPGESRGNTVTARELLDQGAQRLEGDLEEQPLLRARMMQTIANVYYELGLYDKAEDLLLETRAVREELLPRDDPQVIETLVSLATLNRDLGRLDESLKLNRRVLVTARETGDASLLTETLNALGSLHHSMGDLAEAEKYIEAALAQYRNAGLEDEELISAVYHNMGTLFRDMERMEEAEPYLRKALALDEGLYGENHHLVASSLDTLAGVLWGQGRLDEAQPLIERACEIYESSLGPNHPHLAGSLNTLAILQWSQGDLAGAEHNMRRALEIYTTSLGEEHAFVADTLGNLGVILSERGQYEEAVEVYKRAISTTERALGPDHPKVAYTLHNLAVEYRDHGEYDRAEELFLRAIAIREKTLGENAQPVGDTLERYAALLRATGRQEDAERIESRVERIRSQD